MFIENTLFLIPVFFLQIVLNIFFIIFWKSSSLKKFHQVYQAEQKIHDGFIPRFGGLAMLVTLFAIHFFLSSAWMSFLIANILLCLLPLFFVTFIEDTYNNIQPLARLIFILVSSYLILIYRDFELPVIDLPILTDLLIYQSWILVFILVIAVAGMVNAFNFVDGLNGLLLFNFISILMSLLLMSTDVGAREWSEIFSMLTIISLIQLLFNFPKAYIFTGDLGAYSFGFIISILIIVFFGQFHNFLSWQAILILFYPVCEFLFTCARRLMTHRRLFRADRLHLHQLLFHLLEIRLSSKTKANALTTILLTPLWSFPCFWIYLHGIQLSLFDIMTGITFSCSIYLIYYFCCGKLIKHQNQL